MAKTFFTSDYHLGHFNAIKYNRRPYSGLNEMDKAIIDNHNSVIKPEDTVYFLGDFCFKDANYYLQKLNGKFIFIEGSHDRELYNARIPLHKTYSLKINGRHIFMSHTPSRIWEKSHYGSWHLFGHCHGDLQTYNLSIDVGIDSEITSHLPLSFEQIEKIMLCREKCMEEEGRIVINPSSGRKMYCQDDVNSDYERKKYLNQRGEE